MKVTGMFDGKFQNCFYALFSQILVFIRNTLWPKNNDSNRDRLKVCHDNYILPFHITELNG